MNSSIDPDLHGSKHTLYAAKSFLIVTLATICGLGLIFRSSDVTILSSSLRSSSSSSSQSPTELVEFMNVHVNKGTTKPNIVFILADDMAYQNLGGMKTFTGGKVVPGQDLTGITPVLTTMAQNGLVLGNYYAMETCTPTRAALLTGRYPIAMGMQYGVVEMSKGWGMPLEEETLAEIFQDEGYKTHMIGKWHLGHHSPEYLPTARGFDTFTGFLDSENYYFSKKSPSNDRFVDFMVSNEDCYYTYNGPSMHNYSTHLYKDLAVQIIENHDTSSPLFLYMAFNAVHVPFNDIPDDFPNGYREAPDSWLSAGVKELLDAQVMVGMHRRLYAATLNMLDSSVGHIQTALEDRNMMENTYFIFASDNGGCYLGGGKNAPLRGNKATLLEGGTKVDAFIYSPLMHESYAGTVYDKLFHVTDWFPTLLELSGIEYASRDDYEINGVSQISGFQGDEETPRQYMLYNSYTNVAGEDLDMWTNGAFAIRNQQYKLIHYFSNDAYASWQTPYDLLEDDHEWSSNAFECKSLTASVGNFTYALFDLVNDPYETTNLYDSDDEAISAAKQELYSLVVDYNNNAKEDVVNNMENSKISLKTWQEEGGGYVIPWTEAGADKKTSSSSSSNKDHAKSRYNRQRRRYLSGSSKSSSSSSHSKSSKSVMKSSSDGSSLSFCGPITDFVIYDN